MSLKFISQSDFHINYIDEKLHCGWNVIFLLSVEIFVSSGWRMTFLKTKTYLFAYIASETHGDYISVVLFVLVGCALQGKMQLPNKSWYDIVIVHHLMEIAVQIQSLSRQHVVFMLYTCSQSTMTVFQKPTASTFLDFDFNFLEVRVLVWIFFLNFFLF